MADIVALNYYVGYLPHAYFSNKEYSTPLPAAVCKIDSGLTALRFCAENLFFKTNGFMFALRHLISGGIG